MAYDPDVRVEDLQKGLNEWRNIQACVSVPFPSGVKRSNVALSGRAGGGALE
jgi:hypothetical protein